MESLKVKTVSLVEKSQSYDTEKLGHLHISKTPQVIFQKLKKPLYQAQSKLMDYRKCTKHKPALVDARQLIVLSFFTTLK